MPPCASGQIYQETNATSYIELARDVLGLTLRDSSVKNPYSQWEFGGEDLPVYVWSPPKGGGSACLVPSKKGKFAMSLGIAYTGVVDCLSGIKLGREVEILGFNHNLQSSFGISKKTINAIREWIAQTVEAFDAGAKRPKVG